MNLLSKELFFKELDAKDFIRDYLKDSAVSISGGKDSLVVLDLSIRAGIKRFVFGNTSMTFPGTEEYIEKLEDFYDIKIDQVKPARPFLDLVDDLGYPSRRMRWCCEVYKFGPLTEYVLKNKIKYLITGIRSQESLKRKSYEKISRNPLIPAVQINPILDWKEEDVWEYITYYERPYHPLYDNGYDRLGCWMCPFQSEKDFERLNEKFPHLFNLLQESLRKNLIKFGGVGVRNIENYIKEHAWVKNALPLNNSLVGTITYKKVRNKNHYQIECLSNVDFEKVCQNLNLFKRKSEIVINAKIRTIEIESKILNINQILIYCEKQINCVGCGACRSLCPTFALYVKENALHINLEDCISCFNCIKTNKLRAGCIARNYVPLRKKFDIIDLDGKNVNIKKEFNKIQTTKIKNFENNSIELNEKFGLIKTRKDIENVSHTLKKVLFGAGKVDNVYFYSTPEYVLNMKREKGFTTIHINCNQGNAQKHISEIQNLLKNTT